MAKLRIEIPEGALHLIWSVDIEKKPTELMSSQLYPADELEAVLNHAKCLDGDWYILKMCFQNGSPETNYYWGLLPYGAYKKLESVFKVLPEIKQDHESQKVMTTYSLSTKGQALLSHHVRKSIDLPDYVLVLNAVVNLPEATKEALVVMGFPDLDLHLQYLVTCGFLQEQKK